MPSDNIIESIRRVLKSKPYFANSLFYECPIYYLEDFKLSAVLNSITKSCVKGQLLQNIHFHLLYALVKETFQDSYYCLYGLVPTISHFQKLSNRNQSISIWFNSGNSINKVNRIEKVFSIQTYSQFSPVI